MDTYIPRMLEHSVKKLMKFFPVTAIIGARQCGKSSIAKNICNMYNDYLYLDLEDENDLNKITGNIRAKQFLSENMDKLIVIDEVQLRPELFPTLRVLADQIANTRDKNFDIYHPARFLILGSASPMLLRQSGETLAGRITYVRLTTLLVTEIPDCDLKKYFIRGSFPVSYLASSDESSFVWRKSYMSAFLHRDLEKWGDLAEGTMERLWHMLVTVNGQETNHERALSSLKIPFKEAQNYFDTLKSLFLIDSIPQFTKNPFASICKTPKTYITDHGLIANEFEIKSFDDLRRPTNAVTYGTMWEQIVLNHLRAWYPRPNGENIFFYRDKDGNEIDFILTKNRMPFAIECKISSNACMSSGTYAAMEKLGIPEEHAFIVTPFQSSEKSNTITLPELHAKLEEILNAPIE